MKLSLLRREPLLRGLGLLSAQRFRPVIRNRLAQEIRVQPGEPLDHLAFDQVLLDDLRDIVHAHPGIPGPVRMNNQVGSVAAGSERTARSNVDLPLEVTGSDLSAKFLQDLLGPPGRAAAVVVGLAVSADKNMRSEERRVGK